MKTCKHLRGAIYLSYVSFIFLLEVQCFVEHNAWSSKIELVSAWTTYRYFCHFNFRCLHKSRNDFVPCTAQVTRQDQGWQQKEELCNLGSGFAKFLCCLEARVSAETASPGSASDCSFFDSTPLDLRTEKCCG